MSIGRLGLRGPKINDLVTWAAVGGDWKTKALVKALTSPVPGTALTDLIRLKSVEEDLKAAGAAKPRPSHGAPPQPASLPGQPPPAPQSVQR